MFHDALHGAVQGLLIIDFLRLIEVALDVLIDLIDGLEQIRGGILNPGDREREDDNAGRYQDSKRSSENSMWFHSLTPTGRL